MKALLNSAVIIKSERLYHYSYTKLHTHSVCFLILSLHTRLGHLYVHQILLSLHFLSLVGDSCRSLEPRLHLAGQLLWLPTRCWPSISRHCQIKSDGVINIRRRQGEKRDVTSAAVQKQLRYIGT